MKSVGPNGTACCERGDAAVESDTSSIQALPNLSSYKSVRVVLGVIKLKLQPSRLGFRGATFASGWTRGSSIAASP